MPATQSFYFATKINVFLYLFVAQDQETVDDGDGLAGQFHDLLRVELEIGFVADGQDQGVAAFEGLGQIFLDLQALELFLVAEELFLADDGVLVLLLELPPALDVGVVDADLGAHFGEAAHQDLGARIAGVADVLAVGGAADQHLGAGDRHAHVAQGVAHQLRRVQGARVVDVDGLVGDLEDVVLKTEDVLVGPDAQAAVLGQAVAPYPGAGKDHVAVGRAHLDGLDHLADVDAVALGEERPLVEEGQDGGAVGVFDDLGRLRLDGPVEDGQGEFFRMDDLVEELLDAGAGLGIDAAADAPEIADGSHILAAGHDPFIGMGQQRVALDAALAEDAAHDGQGDLLGGAGRDGGLDQHQAFGGHAFGDGLERFLQGLHFHLAAAAVAELVLEEVELDVDDDHVGQGQHLVVVGGQQGLLLEDGAADQRLDLGVLGLDRGYPLVQGRDLPERPR